MSKAILFKPLLTEKSLKDDKVYVFLVDKTATKGQIRENIESLYKVKVLKIQTVSQDGKRKTVGKKRRLKQLPGSKKAFITLKQGEIPDIKVK